MHSAPSRSAYNVMSGSGWIIFDPHKPPFGSIEKWRQAGAGAAIGSSASLSPVDSRKTPLPVQPRYALTASPRRRRCPWRGGCHGRARRRRQANIRQEMVAGVQPVKEQPGDRCNPAREAERRFGALKGGKSCLQKLPRRIAPARVEVRGVLPKIVRRKSDRVGMGVEAGRQRRRRPDGRSSRALDFTGMQGERRSVFFSIKLTPRASATRRRGGSGRFRRPMTAGCANAPPNSR